MNASHVDVPATCQQRGCEAAVETYCPLCERFYCLRHDELVPVRRHDCLGVGAAPDATFSNYMTNS